MSSPSGGIERRVGDFAFTVSLQASRPSCSAKDPEWGPLASALDAARLEEFAWFLEQRWGFGSQGIVGFAYSEGEGDPEVPAGKVYVYDMDRNLYLDRLFFERAAVAYGLAAIELLRSKGEKVDADAEARFKAVDARVRSHGDGRVVALKRRAGGLDFSVEVARDGWTEMSRLDGDLWVLSRALTWLWRDSPDEFAAMLETREGREGKWRYRFSYRDGEVEVYSPETTVRLKTPAFQELACEFGLAAVEGGRLLGREAPARLEERLKAILARI